MKPGDTVQILQLDHAILVPNGPPVPNVPHWVYATVYDVAPGETHAHVEVNHPANAQHGKRLLVARKDLRTFEDLQKLHDAHPDAATEHLQYNIESHKSLINLRAALDRCKPQEEAA
jgi:hypothetical protein